ncbi:MAG: HNH endonuclease signature motif containing protein [Patescibacteria group bacterium]
MSFRPERNTDVVKRRNPSLKTRVTSFIAKFKMKPRKWTIDQLRIAVKESTSVRAVLFKLGLVPAGGNYVQVKQYINKHGINCDHFKGAAWNKGLSGLSFPRVKLNDILSGQNLFQSHKLKIRLFKEGLKKPKCEMCGWDKKNAEGYQPLELQHVNGDRFDNRLDNLRILCPNCHSLQPTHRGRNMKIGKK